VVSPVVGVPVPALKAYGYAQLRTTLALPGCHLSWTTLAGIGKVESGHGAAGGATLRSDGEVTPPIVGPVLNGEGGRALVRDTDLGHYDGDSSYDRAIGPLQFLPATWEAYQADGDADGRRDPSDINDAALAAANFLCAGGRDLARPADWWAAVLAYNNVTAYAQSVFAAADQYGRLSRTVRPTTGG
jgi:membrane-bound lytic murein transglycosylase B